MAKHSLDVRGLKSAFLSNSFRSFNVMLSCSEPPCSKLTAYFVASIAAFIFCALIRMEVPVFLGAIFYFPL